MKNIIILGVLVLSISGCYSNLKVMVKVADRDQVIANSPHLISGEITESLILLESFLASSTNDKNIYIENIKSFQNRLDPAYPLAPATIRAYENAFDVRIGSIRDDVNNARTNFDAKKIEEAFVYINQANLKVLSFINDLKTLEVNLTYRGNVREEKVDAAENTAINATGLQVVRQRQRYPILGDPMTSYITKDDNKDIWKSLFNKTISRNLFGNSDIAVILRSNPPENEIKSGDYNNNFTIKGVRMDAADATNAFFTGLTQTMNFIASTQGISLPSTQTGTTENPLPDQNPLITGMQADIKSYESKKKKLEDIRKMLIDKINQEDVQNKTGAQLDASIVRIEEFWTTLKTELNK